MRIFLFSQIYISESKTNKQDIMSVHVYCSRILEAVDWCPGINTVRPKHFRFLNKISSAQTVDILQGIKMKQFI